MTTLDPRPGTPPSVTASFLTGGTDEPGWERVLAATIAAATAEPAAAWRATTEAAAAALTPLAGAAIPFGAPVVAGLDRSVADDAADTPGGVWQLDRDPVAGDVVVLGRTADVGGNLDRPTLAWYLADDLELRDTNPAPGMRLWGGTEVVLDGTEPVLAEWRPGTYRPCSEWAAVLGPEGPWQLLVGAHALGVAGLFRNAFVDKATASARGWSKVLGIDDPTNLKAIARADGVIAAAAALLERQARRAVGVRTAGRVLTDGHRAELAAASIHALDAARTAVDELHSLTGASALYDANPMQIAALHLAVLGQHRRFSRDTRLHVARALTRSVSDTDPRSS